MHNSTPVYPSTIPTNPIPAFRILTDAERMQQELNYRGTITIGQFRYDIVGGHFFIDGRYGYDSSQRICDDDENGNCLGIMN